MIEVIRSMEVVSGVTNEEVFDFCISNLQWEYIPGENNSCSVKAKGLMMAGAKEPLEVEFLYSLSEKPFRYNSAIVTMNGKRKSESIYNVLLSTMLMYYSNSWN